MQYIHDAGAERPRGTEASTGGVPTRAGGDGTAPTGDGENCSGRTRDEKGLLLALTLSLS